MKMIFAIVLAMFGTVVSAAYPCIPKEHGGTGDYTSIAETPFAIAVAFRCSNASDPTKPIYARTVLKDYVPPMSCAAAIVPAVVAQAASSVAARSLLPLVNAAAAVCDSIPLEGTVERQRYDEARSLALMMTRAKYAAANPPGGPVLKATGGTIYKFENNKLTPIFTRKATIGVPCNCSLARTNSGTLTLCALEGGTATEVTACK